MFNFELLLFTTSWWTCKPSSQDKLHQNKVLLLANLQHDGDIVKACIQDAVNKITQQIIRNDYGKFILNKWSVYGSWSWPWETSPESFLYSFNLWTLCTLNLRFFDGKLIYSTSRSFNKEWVLFIKSITKMFLLVNSIRWHCIII